MSLLVDFASRFQSGLYLGHYQGVRRWGLFALAWPLLLFTASSGENSTMSLCRRPQLTQACYMCGLLELLRS